MTLRMREGESFGAGTTRCGEAGSLGIGGGAAMPGIPAGASGPAPGARTVLTDGDPYPSPAARRRLGRQVAAVGAR